MIPPACELPQQSRIHVQGLLVPGPSGNTNIIYFYGSVLLILGVQSCMRIHICAAYLYGSLWSATFIGTIQRLILLLMYYASLGHNHISRITVKLIKPVLKGQPLFCSTFHITLYPASSGFSWPDATLLEKPLTARTVIPLR